METYALILILFGSLIAALSLSYLCRRCYKKREIHFPTTFALRRGTIHSVQSLSTISSLSSHAISGNEIRITSYGVGDEVAERVTSIGVDYYGNKHHGEQDYSSFGSNRVSYRDEGAADYGYATSYADSGRHTSYGLLVSMQNVFSRCSAGWTSQSSETRMQRELPKVVISCFQYVPVWLFRDDSTTKSSFKYQGAAVFLSRYLEVFVRKGILLYINDLKRHLLKLLSTDVDVTVLPYSG